MPIDDDYLSLISLISLLRCYSGALMLPRYDTLARY